MPITISVTAETSKDLSGLILGLAGEFQSLPIERLDTESKVKASKATKIKSKKETEANLLEDDQPEVSKKSKAKKLTKTNAQDALAKLNSEKGILVAKEVLANFGAQRLSDVEESDYELFITACEEYMAATDKELID